MQNQTQAERQEIFTTREARQILRCSEMTLWRMRRDGQLDSLKLRGRRLFTRHQLESALKRAETKPSG